MNLTNLKTMLAPYPAFRLKQTRHAIYKNLIEDWNEDSTLPKEIREKLQKECSLEIPAKILESDNKRSVKALITLDDKSKIETVLMRYENGKNVVCVSCQVGCPMGCTFCATGDMGIQRNLTTDEILIQILLFSRYLKKENKRVRNVVFMGMGEPE